MSACEKCWTDARGIPEVYDRFLRERRDHPCTPEEQAGRGGELCPNCGRRSLHQYTGEAMCGCRFISGHDYGDAQVAK